VTLVAGARFGVYEIVSPIGAGGMGEVYRAKDTKLGRDVAIKVLPAEVAKDAERLGRFRREAQLLAALNHPNIAAIHGLDEAAGQMFLVLELVDGEDLAERLKRGAIPVDEAIAIGKQIAEALEEAHEHGIVHRDLKPANVKLTPDGKVKVLDFGLAKACSADPTQGAASELSHSPTMTRQGTEAGVILGTAAYMSPEQARGKSVDRRTDIWALGVVLFEMLTGQRLFARETVSDTLAAVLKTDPDWKRLPADTPYSVERLVRRCLDRDVKARLQAIGEARIALSHPAREDAVAPPTTPPATGAFARALPWAVAAIALAAAAWMSRTERMAGPGPRQATYLDVALPPEIEPLPTAESGFDISPDGRLVAITGVRGGARRLYVRRLSSDETREIADSSGVNGATFSPDSGSLAFVGTSGLVITVSLADQKRAVVGRGDLSGGVAWGPTGIVFGRNGALWLVPTDGGKERALTTLDAARKEVLHSNQLVLPGGRAILFSSLTSEPGSERIEAVSVEGGSRTVVLERASTPVWAPTGHLLFGRDGAVLATAFDPKSLKATGTATNVIGKGLVGTTNYGNLGIRMSQNGDLLLLPNNYQARLLDSVARDGSAVSLAFPRARYQNPRLSPDGRRLMVEVAGVRLDALDLERQTLSRLTPEGMGVSFCIWNSDGRYILFRRYNSPYWIAADGSGRQGSIPRGAFNDRLSGPGPDPDSFFSTRITPDTGGDIMLLSRTGTFEPKPLIATPAYEGGAQLSKDGRWLAYVSNESGQSEIHVRRYPSLDRRWQVSASVGLQPRWRPDGREIFYRDGQNMIAVPFDGSGNEPAIGKPVALFKDEYDLGFGLTIANYDVTGDGHFLMLRRDAKGVGLRIVLNWTEELKEILAKGGVR